MNLDTIIIGSDTMIVLPDSIETLIDDCEWACECCVDDELISDSGSSVWFELFCIASCMAVIALIVYAVYKIISNRHKIKTMWMELLPRKSEETDRQEKTYSIFVVFVGLLFLLLIIYTCSGVG